MATSRSWLTSRPAIRRSEPGANFWVARHTTEFVDLLGGGEEVEGTAAPQREDPRGRGSG